MVIWLLVTNIFSSNCTSSLNITSYNSHNKRVVCLLAWWIESVWDSFVTHWWKWERSLPALGIGFYFRMSFFISIDMRKLLFCMSDTLFYLSVGFTQRLPTPQAYAFCIFCYLVYVNCKVFLFSLHIFLLNVSLWAFPLNILNCRLCSWFVLLFKISFFFLLRLNC